MTTSDKVLWDAWYIVATVRECQPGIIKQISLLQKNLVLWRGDTPESSIKVWEDRCPHRGTHLSLGKISQDRLICPYHGWNYDRDGKCVRVPSLPAHLSPPNACVKTYPCQERWGYIWVCLGNPSQEIPAFPEWDDPDYRKIYYEPYRFHSSAFRVMENGFDMSHFYFVHSGSLGDPDDAVMEDYDVEVDRDVITIDNFRCWQQNPGGTGVPGEITYLQKIYPPLTIYTLKKFHDSRRFSWFLNVQPIDEEDCLMWLCLAMNYGHETPEKELVEFQDRLYDEDVFIVESQRPKSLPLGVSSEVHTRCDRVSTIYRRWLKEMGVTFGVC